MKEDFEKDEKVSKKNLRKIKLRKRKRRIRRREKDKVGNVKKNKK